MIAIQTDDFRELIEQSTMALVVYDGKTARLIYANARMAEISGRTVEELIGIELGSFAHPDDRAAIRQRGLERRTGVAPAGLNEIRIVRPDGTIRDVETQSAVRTINGRDLIAGRAAGAAGGAGTATSTCRCSRSS